MTSITSITDYSITVFELRKQAIFSNRMKIDKD